MSIRGNLRSELRWGLLGVGKIALRSVIPALLKSEGQRLVAVGSGRPERARTELQKWGEKTQAVEVMDYASLVAQPSIDAVYIALPNHLHHPWTIRALEAGKHVLCEKPLAVSLEQAEQMNALARDQNLRLAEAFMYRHHPQWQVVRDWLGQGDIGELRCIRSTFTYALDDLSNIRLRADCAGGALMDVGCYGIDVSRWLTGEEPIAQHLDSFVGAKSGVDERSCIQLRFPSGVMSQVFCSTDAYRENRVELLGTTGRIDVPCAFVVPPGKVTKVLLHNAKGQQVEKVEGADAYGLEIDAFARMMIPVEGSIPLENGRDNAVVLSRLRGRI